MTTSRRRLPLRYRMFYPKLPPGVRQKAVSAPSGNAALPVLLTHVWGSEDSYD